MLRKALAVLILIAVVAYFLVRPEGNAVSLLDWLRDPGGSQQAHAEFVASERERARLEPVAAPRILLDESDAARPTHSAQSATQSAAEAAQPDLSTLLEASAYRLRGRLCGLDGQPWPALTVSAQQPGQALVQAQSDEYGTFELKLRGVGGALSIDRQVWVLLAGELGLAPGLSLGSRPRTLILAPRVDLGGNLQDERGTPLAGVELRVSCELAGVAALDLVPLLPDRFELRAHSDSAGLFRLDELPELADLRVRFVLAGHAPQALTLAQLRTGEPVVLAAEQP